MEMWEKIADFCDPDLKGEIFMTMLTGEFTGRITVTGIQDHANAVSCIKSIRTVDKRKLGLKEAKDMYDGIRFNKKAFNLEVDSRNRNTAVKELRLAGLIV
jgi:ribosomal protein L7/L12